MTEFARPDAAASRPRRIVTVCLGNICRSPFAALVLATQGGGAVEVRSAGLSDKWAGTPADPAMVAAAASRGYDLTCHQARQVDAALLEWADAILAMDNGVLAALMDLADPAAASKLELYLGDRDVPDPWGHGESVFIACVASIEAGAARHLQ